MIIMSGKEPAKAIKDIVKGQVEHINRSGEKIKLAVIQVGRDDASSVYIRNKKKACEYVGIELNEYLLPEYYSKEDLERFIECLNDDKDTTGIIVQLPLPKHMDEKRIASLIKPEKDVDGFNPVNVGNMLIGSRSIIPCTPFGIVALLEQYGIDIEGKNCVVVGRSNIVGKPVASLLLRHNGTVTVCHSKTKNLKDICKNADILVCAIGKPKFFTKEYVKDGAVVIDVGIHRTKDGKICGDVDFDNVKDVAGAITPVPGGVGLMTVAMLMYNCVEAYEMQHDSEA